MDHSLIDVKAAVQKAKAYLADLFEGEGITHVGLEEVEYDAKSNEWRITVGFSRPWDQKNIVTAALSEGRPLRTYKVVRMRDNDGRVLSVKDRVLTTTE